MPENSFEKSIEALDAIVKALEKGDVPLDDMLKLFEQGIALSRTCNEMLDAAEKKVNLLIKKDDGFEKQPFNPTEGV